MNQLHGYTPQLYVCLNCKQIHDEQALGRRWVGYWRLCCTAPGCRGDVRLIQEGEEV
jgi:hypothetical protein